MNFKSHAEMLAITADQAEAFNKSNDLSLFYDSHSWHTQAAAATDAIGQGELVGIEKGSYDLSLPTLDLDSLDRVPKGEMIDKYKPAFLMQLMGRLAYSGLQLHELKKVNPSRFQSYMERAFDELDSVNGIIGLNPYAGYTLKLCLGVIEKDGIYIPSDADSVQLPVDLANDIRINGSETEQLNMHHYRDRALTYNIVTTSMEPYRQALGLGSCQKLPITIVRGSGHRFSLGAILDETGIEHRDQLIDRPQKSGRKEIIVPSSFIDVIEQPTRTAENALNTGITPKKNRSIFLRLFSH